MRHTGCAALELFVVKLIVMAVCCIPMKLLILSLFFHQPVPFLIDWGGRVSSQLCTLGGCADSVIVGNLLHRLSWAYLMAPSSMGKNTHVLLWTTNICRIQHHSTTFREWSHACIHTKHPSFNGLPGLRYWHGNAGRRITGCRTNATSISTQH